MLTIEIDESTKTASQMATVLTRVAELLEQGYVSGQEPSWSLSGEAIDPLTARRCAQCNSLLEPDAEECDECTSTLLLEPNGDRVG